MSTWGHLPWENDSAADWFGDTFDQTKLAQRVEDTLNLDVEDSADEIRAAAAVLLLLGHTFVWPVKEIDRHLALAADRLSEIKESGIYDEAPEIVASLDAEIQELRRRIKESPPLPQQQTTAVQPEPESIRKWWEFWR